MLHQGRLKDWDPVKGAGFIQQDKAGPDIRILSSGFRKLPDRLQNGDIIYFQIEVNSQGQTKAVSAYKAGQNFVPAPTIKKPITSSMSFQHLLSVLVALSILAWLGYQSVYLFSAQAALPVQRIPEAVIELENPVWPPIQSQHFQCEGKQHCTEMVSCEEAKFYLAHCPDVLIDGDNDGIPCERQHCGH